MAEPDLVSGLNDGMSAASRHGMNSPRDEEFETCADSHQVQGQNQQKRQELHSLKSLCAAGVAFPSQLAEVDVLYDYNPQNPPTISTWQAKAALPSGSSL
jgi:hypothetical protein